MVVCGCGVVCVAGRIDKETCFMSWNAITTIPTGILVGDENE